ncbi:hemolysin family protein [candidate division KSB1 bacterium]
MDISLSLAGLALLLCLSAFFSGSESAIFSLGHVQLRGLSATKLLKHPGDLLVLILSGNLLVNVGITTIATIVCINYFGDRGAETAVLIITPLLLLFGEIVPKSIALKANEKVSLRVAPIFEAGTVWFRPIIRIFNWANLGLIRLTDPLFPPRRLVASPEELKTIIELGHDQGEFEHFEREIIGRLMDFKVKRVREVMTPRVGVFSLDDKATCREAKEEARVRGLSFIPVTTGEPESVAGILYLKDLLPLDEAAMSRPVAEMSRPAHFVPEAQRLDELFRELQERSLRIAVVVGESDIFSGVVTLEDLLSEILGEIRFKIEMRRFTYRFIDADTVIVAGDLKLSTFNNIFKTDFFNRHYETVAGYILHQCGSIPKTGDKLEYDGLKFTILRGRPNRIERIKITRLRREG